MTFGGVERAVFEQVLSENECQDLIHLASVSCITNLVRMRKDRVLWLIKHKEDVKITPLIASYM